MPEVQGEINASRVLEGLAASGYTPETAICDIVDNSVNWGAKNVSIELEKDPNLAQNRLNNARRYVIADDGEGMDEAGLRNALALGSIAAYPTNSLSLFGLGLKSAAFSQGRCLEIFTKKADQPLMYGKVDLDAVQERGSYVLTIDTVSDGATGDDLVDAHFATNRTGTVVLMSKIRMVNHPSVKSTAENLEAKLGTIYQFFLTRGLEIRIGGTTVQPFDPLFLAEANLNEQERSSDAQNPLVDGSWNGRTVEWLQKPTDVLLDPERKVTARLEATQLPHPPTFQQEQQQNATRVKYRIGAGEYGIFVYRNDRLIAYAEHFGNLIAQDQDLYSFRGRLFLDESADEVMNIDLKKSRVMLSEAAWNALRDVLLEPIRMSRNGWRRRTQHLNELAGKDPDSTANSALSAVDLPDEFPTDPTDAKSEEERTERRKREIARHPLPADESEAVEKSGKRVLFVPTLDDNVLWERAHDPELGVVVRINQSHRFVREVYGALQNDPNAVLVLHTLFLALANGESHAVRTISRLSDEVLEDVFRELRYGVSSTLYKLTADVLAPKLAE